MEIIASAPLETERVRRHEPARHSRSAQPPPRALRGRQEPPQGWYGVTSPPAPQKKGHPTPVSQKLGNLGCQRCPVPSCHPMGTGQGARTLVLACGAQHPKKPVGHRRGGKQPQEGARAHRTRQQQNWQINPKSITLLLGSRSAGGGRCQHHPARRDVRVGQAPQNCMHGAPHGGLGDTGGEKSPAPMSPPQPWLPHQHPWVLNQSGTGEGFPKSVTPLVQPLALQGDLVQ